MGPNCPLCVHNAKPDKSIDYKRWCMFCLETNGALYEFIYKAQAIEKFKKEISNEEEKDTGLARPRH